MASERGGRAPHASPNLSRAPSGRWRHISTKLATQWKRSRLQVPPCAAIWNINVVRRCASAETSEARVP